MNLIIISLYLIFVLSALVLIVVILLQEGKGGGFGEALGQAGQQTFGVKARGIQTFTGVAAGVFLLSALLIHIINRMEGSASVVDPLGGGVPEAPADGN